MIPAALLGRPPDPAASDEISINEQLADELGVAVGDEVDVYFWARGDESWRGAGRAVQRTHVRARVVGSAASAIDEARITAGPGVAAALADGGVGPRCWRR